MKRTKLVQIELSEKELAAWQAAAKEQGCTVSEWVRRRTRGPGRLRPARKPIVEPEVCEHDIPMNQFCEACFGEEEVEDDYDEDHHDVLITPPHAKERTADDIRERKSWAAEQVKAAGSVDAWYRSLAADVRAAWEDLRPYLLQCEKAQAEQEKMLKSHTGTTEAKPQTPKPPVISGWRPPSVATGIIEIDNPEDLNYTLNRTMARIVRRDDLGPPKTDPNDDGPAGFDD
jgi:hypothetical protein